MYWYYNVAYAALANSYLGNRGAYISDLEYKLPSNKQKIFCESQCFPHEINFNLCFFPQHYWEVFILPPANKLLTKNHKQTATIDHRVTYTNFYESLDIKCLYRVKSALLKGITVCWISKQISSFPNILLYFANSSTKLNCEFENDALFHYSMVLLSHLSLWIQQNIINSISIGFCLLIQLSIRHCKYKFVVYLFIYNTLFWFRSPETHLNAENFRMSNSFKNRMIYSICKARNHEQYTILYPRWLHYISELTLTL